MSNEMKNNSLKDTTRNTFLQRHLPTRLKRFCQDEDGAVVAFMLYMFLVFLLMGGIGIDTMRHEMERTRIAAVADAASLAGATAPNNEEAKKVVEDYFEKIGMADNLEAFGEDDIQITLNTSKVTVNTSVHVDTYLMQLMGIDTLSAAGEATAEKRIPKLEIALVLDVSGSMDGQKLTDLKKAAKQFVTTILGSADPGDAVISIIPFSFGVTPSDNMYSALTVDQTHNYSTCIVFQEDDFDDTAINPSTTYPQQIYTSRYDVSGDFQTLNSSWRSCYTDDYFRVLPYSISETALHTKIDSLQADGNTSGHLGIKWAAGLLDPAFRPVTTSLITAGDVDASLSNVPAEYNELATQKVIVMMGDGANTNSYYFNDPNGLLDTSTPETHVMNDYRGPGSHLWRVKYNDDVFQYRYYTYNHSYRKYNEYNCGSFYWNCVYNSETLTNYFLYNPDTGKYWDTKNEEWLTQTEFNDLDVVVENGEEQRFQLSWEEAWGQMSPDYYDEITGIGAPYYDYRDGETVDGSMKNTRMASSCTAAKATDKRIKIYTIGFEVPAGGTAETELKNCASTPTEYYRAKTGGGSDPEKDLDIASVFGSIASSIQNLRLTQ